MRLPALLRIRLTKQLSLPALRHVSALPEQLASFAAEENIRASQNLRTLLSVSVEDCLQRLRGAQEPAQALQAL